MGQYGWGKSRILGSRLIIIFLKWYRSIREYTTASIKPCGTFSYRMPQTGAGKPDCPASSVIRLWGEAEEGYCACPGDGKVEQFMLLAPEGAVVTHIWRSLKLNYAMARMVYQSKAVSEIRRMRSIWWTARDCIQSITSSLCNGGYTLYLQWNAARL